MEEKQSDKDMRDKLQAAEYPYDPQAWGQMEAILDNKEKRRGIIWWWPSGIAAALLLGGIATYMLVKQPEEKIAAQGQLANQTIQGAKETTGTDANEKNEKSSVAGNEINNARSTEKGNTEKKEKLSISVTTLSTDKRNKVAGIEHSVSNKKHARKEKLQGITEKEKNVKNADVQSTLNMSESAKEKPVLLSNKIKTTDDYDAIPLLNGGELAVENNRELAGEKNESIYKKAKKKTPIHYLIGAEAGASAAYIHGTLGNLPCWGIGWTQELKIGKYVGITNSILYSETNFKINNPAYPDFTSAYPTSYRSNNKELSIPVGIKVYPYSKGGISWYLAASYINHIRISESFNYVVKTDTRVTTSFIPDNITSEQYQSMLDMGNSLQNYTAAAVAPAKGKEEYFSLGASKIYYGSLLLGTGIDYRISQHFQLSMEPFFGMSLTKVKLQDSRLYSGGGNVRLMYRF